MLNKKTLLVVLLSIVLAFSLSCSKKQMVKEEGVEQIQPPAETEITEEIPAVEEEPVAEKPVAKPAMPVCDDVFFDFDKYNLKEESKATLENDASELKKFSDLALTIEGHCDERGTEDYNMALGEKRAKAVKDYLVSLGIPASWMTVISYGETRPFDPGHDEEAWAKNRRAHFVINQ